jgi:hypothetical protein
MEEKEKEKELRMDEAPFNSRKHLKLLHLYIEIRERIAELTKKYLSDIDAEQERLNLIYSLADKGIREELLKLARHNFK